MTKNELIAALNAMTAERDALLTTLNGAREYTSRLRDAYRALLPSDVVTTPAYPLTDARGRSYRMDGRVKCYPASH